MFESLSRALTQKHGSSLDFPPFFLRSEEFHICSSDVDVKGYSQQGSSVFVDERLESVSAELIIRV